MNTKNIQRPFRKRIKRARRKLRRAIKLSARRTDGPRFGWSIAALRELRAATLAAARSGSEERI